MPSVTGEDDDIVMRAVEERVKQWKVCFLLLLDLLNNKLLFLRIFLKQKTMKLMILNEE
jgi:hypothetical protein